MSYHGKLQTLKNGTADAEIQQWAHQQLEKLTKYELRHAEQRKRIDELEAEVKQWKEWKESLNGWSKK